MTIRPANKKDLNALALLFDAYRVFYKRASDIDAAKAFLAERLENKDSELFIAENEDQILVGFTQLYPLFSSTRMKRTWLLNDLYVATNYRGLGVSKQLIAQAKILAKSTNAYGVLLETEKTNTIGNQLYPSVGFTLNTVSNFYEWTNPNTEDVTLQPNLH